MVLDENVEIVFQLVQQPAYCHTNAVQSHLGVAGWTEVPRQEQERVGAFQFRMSRNGILSHTQSHIASIKRPLGKANGYKCLD